MAEETQHRESTSSSQDAGSETAPTPSHGELPLLPPTAEAFAGKAKDLQALRDALVDAASVGAGLWFSYLFVLFYLLIAVGSVTHRDLFSESAVKLPFLNVDLPLLGFFALGPAIFLIVHTYVLLHFVLLAGKVGDFDAELRAQIADEEVRRRLRRQLPSNIFVQFLAGSREVRSGIMGFMLRLIAQISLILGPIALLVFFELQFLPYHHEAITWWHRIAVLADIALLWTLWPSVARGERAGLAWRDLRRFKIVALAVASLAPVLLVTTIATFPGEWLEDTVPSLQFIPWKDRKEQTDEKNKRWRLVSLHELLVAGDVGPLGKLVSLREFLIASKEVDFGARKPKSLWSNRLVLPGFDAIDHARFDSEAKIEAASETVSLRARHLEGAILIGAKLRKADLTAALLQGAQLDHSDLRGAKFDCGNNQEHPPQQCARLQGASLIEANLQGAALKYGELQGAILNFANLQGAKLGGAQLQGATLDGAKLQGAQLDDAKLQGAALGIAQLQGATLDGAALQGAALDSAELQVTSLVLADLRGASLHSTSFNGALLQQTQLDGASLYSTKFKGARLSSVWVWRVDNGWADLENAWVEGVKTVKTSPEDFEHLKKMIATQVPEGDMRDAAMARIEDSLDPIKVQDRESEMAKAWEVRVNSPTTKDLEIFEQHHAEIWQETGCVAEEAPYVIRGLLVRLKGLPPPFTLEIIASALAKAFLDEKHCAGAQGLTDAEKAELKEIRDRSPATRLKH
jgi:uncharacterized protein YjbI with pentapeptide repeats